MGDGVVKDLQVDASNRARDMIESFMIAANGVTARFLSARGSASIRRVVRAPKRWPRIVEIAATHGTTLPRRSGCRRARNVPARAAGGAAGHLPGSLAEHPEAAGARGIRRREPVGFR